MKLKTLKDIEWGGTITGDGRTLAHHQNIFEELRNEAIKWIKVLLKGNCEYLLPMEDIKGDYVLDIKSKRAIIIWLKHFFNITEKDLK